MAPKNGYILLLPLATFALLAFLWLHFNRPIPHAPCFLGLGPLVLLIFLLWPHRPRQSWLVPRSGHHFKWQQSGKSLLWQIGQGALPAALLALSFSLADFALNMGQKHHDIDAVLVYDYSASMTAFDPDGYFRHEKAHEIARQLILDNDCGQIGLVGFAERAVLLSPLTPQSNILAQILNRPPPDLGKNTAIGDALMIALAHLVTSKAQRKQIIVISDGLNNSGLISLPEAVASALELQIPIHTIIIGSERQKENIVPADSRSLQELATQSGGQLFKPENLENLQKTFREAPLIETPSQPVNTDFSTYPALFLLVLSLLELAPWRPKHG